MTEEKCATHSQFLDEPIERLRGVFPPDVWNGIAIINKRKQGMIATPRDFVGWMASNALTRKRDVATVTVIRAQDFYREKLGIELVLSRVDRGAVQRYLARLQRPRAEDWLFDIEMFDHEKLAAIFRALRVQSNRIFNVNGKRRAVIIPINGCDSGIRIVCERVFKRIPDEDAREFLAAAHSL